MNVHVRQVGREGGREGKHLSLRLEQLDTIPSCCKIHTIFYRICFSTADGSLHIFSPLARGLSWAAGTA